MLLLGASQASTISVQENVHRSATCAGVQRRGHWRKAHLDAAAGVDPAHDPSAPGGGAIALSNAGASAQGKSPGGKGEGKARLFTGAPSATTVDIEAHSAP